MPIFKAFHAGVPIAGSNTRCIPDQVGDAGALFHPDGEGGMADTIFLLPNDPGLRELFAASVGGELLGCPGKARRGNTALSTVAWAGAPSPMKMSPGR